MDERFPSQDPLIKLQERMRLAGLSRKTEQSYLYYVRACLEFTRKGPARVATEDVEFYLGHLVKLGHSASTLNTAYSALKYYFDGVLKRHFFCCPAADEETQTSAGRPFEGGDHTHD
jgi:site-specific recombinase XerD